VKAGIGRVMLVRIRPLVILGDERKLYPLRDEYERWLGFRCVLTPGKLVVQPKWNDANLGKK